MSKKIVFNGKSFINIDKRGIDRYTYEILLELDKICDIDNIEIIIPNVEIKLPKFNNIKFVKFGGFLGYKIWQYIDYQYYVLKNNALSISFSAEEAPLINPGIVTIHDIFHERYKNQEKGLEWFIKNKYHLIINRWLIKKAKAIITVSNFSKKEIVNYYKCNGDNIVVIYNAWQHLCRIKINEEKLKKKYKDLIEKEYYFFLGGQEKRKNIRWICEIAKKYPDRQFIVAGPPLNNSILADDSIKYVKNIRYIGYITNEEIGFFMKNCKAFIFPSLYEGFGIPPLEAIFFGAKVFLSNSSCLPEIFKNFAVYFNPNDYNVDLERLEKEEIIDSKNILKYYSWEKSAKILLNLIKKTIEK